VRSSSESSQAHLRSEVATDALTAAIPELEALSPVTSCITQIVQYSTSQSLGSKTLRDGGIAPSLGTTGDVHDHGLRRSVTGLTKAEMVRAHGD
jgi:hypothetical protein